jgi:large subunit ribosomal protein L10
MALNLQGKQAIIKELNESTSGALSAITADFRGVPVVKINELRKVCRESSVNVHVVRNTLLKRAIKDTIFECLKTEISGPTLIACSTNHPGTAARLLKNFAKDNQGFEVKAAAFEGELLTKDKIDRLASLPTYSEAIAHLAAAIKEASAGKLVRTLAAILEKRSVVL